MLQNWGCPKRVFCESLLLGLVMSGVVRGADGPAPGEFLDRVISDEAGEHGYVIYTPPGFKKEQVYPVVLFLHGSGERGTDNKKQLRVGLGPALREDPTRCPAIVIFPQAESKARMPIEVWAPTQPDGKRALSMLDRTTQEYKIDADRVYLTGISMGGMGSWRQAMADPDRWAAVVPICGGGNSAQASVLVQMPIWCFHGGADLVVPTAFSRQMINALKKAGGEPKYTEYPGVGHDSWSQAYREPELWSWLFAQNRKDRVAAPKP
jgi:predicted peptidase